MLARLALAMCLVFAGWVGHALIEAPRPAIAQNMPTDAKDGFKQALAALVARLTAAAHEVSGDTDEDFVAVMGPYLQGAIDLAQLFQRFGNSADGHAIAESVIKANEADLQRLRTWYAANH
jgi:uncharacterized protein (DUF305 family)